MPFVPLPVASPPPAPPAPPDEDRRADQRRRLLRGIGATVAAKGYAATTIADIVGEARVSKRTFYEHFDDKLGCFLEAYRMGSELLLRRMVAGARADDALSDGAGPELGRLRAGLRAYLSVLAQTPAPTRTFTLEIHAAGPRALELRRAMHRRTAATLRALVDDVRAELPDLRPLDPVMAEAVVGALTELVANAVADGRTDRLTELDAPVLALVHAVLSAPDLPAGTTAPTQTDHQETT